MTIWDVFENNLDNGLSVLTHMKMYITIKLAPSVWNEETTICPIFQYHYYYFNPGGLAYGF